LTARNPFFGLWTTYSKQSDPWLIPENAAYRRELYAKYLVRTRGATPACTTPCEACGSCPRASAPRGPRAPGPARAHQRNADAAPTSAPPPAPQAWLSAGTGPRLKISHVFSWSGGTWDVLGTHYGSTTAEGSFKDPEIFKQVAAHNAKVNGGSG
jgi:hypothetical protein